MKFWIAVIAYLAISSPANCGEQIRDGDLISTTPCDGNSQSYAQWLANEEANYTSEAETARERFATQMPPFAVLSTLLLSGSEFDRRRHDGNVACERVIYASDGLKVAGFI